MGLLSRIRQRLSRRGQDDQQGARTGHRPGIGARWTPAMEKEWEELPEQVDASLKKVGSAIVGSWEVGAAELARVLVGHPQDRAWIERYSDALVPGLAPWQDLHKGCSAAMAQALADAKRSGDLLAVQPPLLELIRTLPRRADEGFLKTVAYLEPMIAGTADPAALRAFLQTGGPELRQSAEQNMEVLRAGLARLPEAPTLFDGVCTPFDDWQAAMCRDVEIRLDRLYRRLVADIKAAR